MDGVLEDLRGVPQHLIGELRWYGQEQKQHWSVTKCLVCNRVADLGHLESDMHKYRTSNPQRADYFADWNRRGGWKARREAPPGFTDDFELPPPSPVPNAVPMQQPPPLWNQSTPTVMYGGARTLPPPMEWAAVPPPVDRAEPPVPPQPPKETMAKEELPDWAINPTATVAEAASGVSDDIPPPPLPPQPPDAESEGQVLESPAQDMDEISQLKEELARVKLEVSRLKCEKDEVLRVCGGRKAVAGMRMAERLRPHPRIAGMMVADV